MNIQEGLKAAIAGQNLAASEMEDVMRQIMTGEATLAQIGGFLVALRIKGETVEEITAAAKVMRELSAKVAVNGTHIVDTCGTGGDGAGVFNVSTATAFVCAAAGATVAKHGNRSISSKSGSADLLEAAGASLALTPAQVETCIAECGVGFMFAPAHHSAMKHAIGPRKEMAVRTIFNVLGPLTNPAGAPNQVLGVFDNDLLEPLAEVLSALGSRHVMVVRSADGLDEISHAAVTEVAELVDGAVKRYQINPADYGIAGQLEDVVVDSAEASLTLIQQAFTGKAGAAADIIRLNAGAALYVSGLAGTLGEGVELATAQLSNGGAADKLAQFVACTQRLAGES